MKIEDSSMVLDSGVENMIIWEVLIYKGFMEKAVAPHSSTFAWKIPWTEEPGRLQSMGSPRVGHDWATSLSLFTFIHWRRKWQPIPVFLLGESQGRGSLVGCRLWVAQSQARLKRLSSSSSIHDLGFPGGANGKEPTCQCRSHEMWVWSLGREDPLEEGNATHSSILARRILWMEEPGGLQSMGLQNSWTWLSD